MLELLVARDQRLVDERVDVVGEVLVLRVRVGRLHVAAAGPAQRLRRRRRATARPAARATAQQRGERACGSCGLRRGSPVATGARRRERSAAMIPPRGRRAVESAPLRDSRSGTCAMRRPRFPAAAGVPLAMTPPLAAPLLARLADAHGRRRAARSRAGSSARAARRAPAAGVGSASRRRSRARSRGAQRARRAQAARSPIRRTCRSAQRADEIAAAIREHPVVIVCGETGLGQDDAAAEDLPRGRARRARPDRPHAAAAHRGARGRDAHRAGAGQRARRRGRLQGALHRPHAARRVRQADDRRHPARRDAGRPRSSPPTTRSSSTRRTSAASTSTSCWATCKQLLARAAGPQGRHHVGDARRRALRARTSAAAAGRRR